MHRNVMEPTAEPWAGAPTTPSTTPRVIVPFVDLLLANGQVAPAIEQGIHQVIEAGSFVLGPQVQQFAREYAKFCAVAHCVGVGNGTDAIELALRGAGLGVG